VEVTNVRVGVLLKLHKTYLTLECDRNAHEVQGLLATYRREEERMHDRDDKRKTHPNEAFCKWLNSKGKA
jgi:hypothetical protein